VIAHRFEDLVVWQLSHELQNEIIAFTARAVCAGDLRFCDQIRDSARSSTRNTAEGFGRFAPLEFARFLRIAAGSLHETKNHLQDARERGYLDAAEYDQLRRLTLRALKANIRLQVYLRGCKARDGRTP
jgi:four helix bundle protein